MDGETFLARVEEETATELNRLGSQKLLLALTGANLEAEAVLSVAVASERAAAETFEGWADSEGDDRAREVFAAVAAEEREHYERVAEHLDGEPSEAAPDAEGGPVHDHLRELDDTIPRVAAGMVGRGLVSARLHAQVIGFYVNKGNVTMPDVFRELRAETEAMRDRGVDLLDELCETDEDWERAVEAAEAVVRIAYEEYADALSGMGVDPKPVC